MSRTQSGGEGAHGWCAALVTAACSLYELAGWGADGSRVACALACFSATCPHKSLHHSTGAHFARHSGLPTRGVSPRTCTARCSRCTDSRNSSSLVLSVDRRCSSDASCSCRSLYAATADENFPSCTCSGGNWVGFGVPGCWLVGRPTHRNRVTCQYPGQHRCRIQGQEDMHMQQGKSLPYSRSLQLGRTPSLSSGVSEHWPALVHSLARQAHACPQTQRRTLLTNIQSPVHVQSCQFRQRAWAGTTSA